jgi:hypothetical protein
MKTILLFCKQIASLYHSPYAKSPEIIMVHMFSRLGTWVSGAVISVAVFGAVAPAYSAAIVGDLNFSGSLTATSTTFDFLAAGGGSGSFQIGSFAPPNTGFWANPVLLGSSGTILDFSALPTPGFTTIPLGANNIANFLTFATSPASTVSFTLTNLPAGSTNPSLPTTFTQNGSNVTAAFSVIGFFTDSTSPGAKYEGVGAFTTQFNNTTVASLLDTLSRGGSVSATYSASFTSVPEPDMLPSVLGLGMAFAGAIAMRRRVVVAK